MARACLIFGIKLVWPTSKSSFSKSSSFTQSLSCSCIYFKCSLGIECACKEKIRYWQPVLFLQSFLSSRPNNQKLLRVQPTAVGAFDYSVFYAEFSMSLPTSVLLLMVAIASWNMPTRAGKAIANQMQYEGLIYSIITNLIKAKTNKNGF